MALLTDCSHVPAVGAPSISAGSHTRTGKPTFLSHMASGLRLAVPGPRSRCSLLASGVPPLLRRQPGGLAGRDRSPGHRQVRSDLRDLGHACRGRSFALLVCIPLASIAIGVRFGRSCRRAGDPLRLAAMDSLLCLRGSSANGRPCLPRRLLYALGSYLPALRLRTH